MSPWRPLRDPLFRALWVASVVSYTGTWMQNVAAGWVMTDLTMSPIMVGLLQVAISLPVLLIALPAGALADLMDRRRLLLITQSWMAVTSAVLGVVTLLGLLTPWLLLGFIFLLGLGAVMNDPAWQAITPEIMTGEEHASAVALNSAGFNVARAIGPALGGLLLAATNAGFAFLLNAASFAGVIFFLYRWQRKPSTASSERVRAAIRHGVAYVRSAPGLRWVLLRTGLFALGASAVWAMLPLIARPFGEVGYGVLLGSFGMGAVLGAAVLARLRQVLSVDALVGAGIVLFGAASLAIGMAKVFWALCLMMAVCGGAWITILSSLNVTAQTLAPDWVRARTLSMYLLVLQGGLAAGSVLWGAVASRFSLALALALAALVLWSGLALTRHRRLGAIDFRTPATS